MSQHHNNTTDAAQAESLIAKARRATEVGEYRAAINVFDQALGLWRGQSLAEFVELSFARGEAVRLDELRASAAEDRMAAVLALGRHHEAIAELETMVADEPLRERRWTLLMLALYRAGRQADALSVYRQTSELLREELGLEPSRPLQELERSILEHDLSLDAVAVSATPGVSVEVCPFKGLAFFDRADAQYFYGRERLVSDLVARLVEAPLVGILGPSGIGKSSLLRAGVLPALSAGSLPGSGAWRQVLLRPGAHPCTELVRVLKPHGVAVHLNAMHLCTQMRGVREESSNTWTTFWRGLYEEDPSLRDEFLRTARAG